MRPGKFIERLTKSLLLAPAILARHGTLHPKRVQLSGCSHWIHIDPTDRRAIKKFVYNPIRNRIPPPLKFWRDILGKIRPEIAIDVGVNYGECLFGTVYEANTKIYGFEANPRLAPYLRKSRDDHPNAANITIIEGLVSDTLEDSVPFYSDPSWSGTGSAVASLNLGPSVVKSEIPARTIDSVIPNDQIKGSKLVFKMDIEGYEPRAFGGFWNTIDEADLVVGLIEFDTTFIREAGDNPQTFYDRLSERFDIHRLAENLTGGLLKVKNFDDLPISKAMDHRVHTDLFLSTRGAPTHKWLPQDWIILQS